jgi:hypothetical protein
MGCSVEVFVFLLQTHHFITVGFTDGIPGQTLLAGFQEILAPAVIQIAVDAFAATQLGNRALAAQPLQHDTDLFFGRKLAPGFTADLLEPFGGI